jgi:cell division protein FtsB
MRILALTVLALMACAHLAVRADDVGAADNGDQTAAPPAKSTSEPAPTPAAESKADKQLSTELKAAAPKPPNPNRYGFERTDDGFLRFDYQTGQVAFCTARPDGWGCQAVPESRAALERELEQLRAEVADLKNQIRALREPPRPVPPETVPPRNMPKAAPPSTDRTGDTTFSVPGREHLARAANAVQEAWQHFVEMVVGLTNDIRRKTGA